MKLLARLVGRMGLAGEDELHRPFGVVDQLGESIEMSCRNKIGPLVGGEPPGEADRQRAGIEHVAGGFDRRFVFVAAAALAAEATADELDQPVLERVVRFPQFARIDVVDVLPDLRLAHRGLPLGPRVAVVELLHLLGEPDWECGRRW